MSVFFARFPQVGEHCARLGIWGDRGVPCGRWGGKGAGWGGCAVSSPVAEDDGGLGHSDESGMQNYGNQGAE